MDVKIINALDVVSNPSLYSNTEYLLAYYKLYKYINSKIYNKKEFEKLLKEKTR